MWCSKFDSFLKFSSSSLIPATATPLMKCSLIQLMLNADAANKSKSTKKPNVGKLNVLPNFFKTMILISYCMKNSKFK